MRAWFVLEMVLTSALAFVVAVSPGPYASRSLIPFLLGGAALVAGGITWGISASQSTSARGLEGDPKVALLSSAENNRVGGVMLLCTGTLLSLLGAFVVFFHSADQPTVAVIPLAGGGLVSLSWSSL